MFLAVLVGFVIIGLGLLACKDNTRLGLVIASVGCVIASWACSDIERNLMGLFALAAIGFLITAVVMWIRRPKPKFVPRTSGQPSHADYVDRMRREYNLAARRVDDQPQGPLYRGGRSN